MIHAILLSSVACLTPQQELDWPQFQGPHRTGTTSAIDSDFEWGEEGPLELWRQPIGPGYGGVAVHKGEVFLLDRDGSTGDVLRVFDLATGEEEWSKAYQAPGRLNFQGSRTVPAVDDKVIIACGGMGQVTAFDREARDILWSSDMREVFGGIEPMFGWSASPLVVGEKVIATPLGEDVGLVAFDKTSGDELWVSPPVGYSHSTPVLLNILGQEQILFLSTSYQTSGRDERAPTTVSAIDPDSGEFIWQTETPLTRLPIPPPVAVGDDRLFLTGGYRGGSAMLKIAKDSDGYSFEELFHISRGAQVHQPILFEDHLFVIVNENWNHSRRRKSEGGLMCLDLDGKELWRTGEQPFLGRGNLLLAGDVLVSQDGETGRLRLIRATPDGYDEIASADLFGVDDGRGEEFWAPMALAGNKLLLRSQSELACVNL